MDRPETEHTQNPQVETPRAEEPRPPRKSFSDYADDLLFATRWVLYPINFGLIVALTIYLVKFLYQVGELLFNAKEHIFGHSAGHSQLMIEMVSLLDQAMIASLMILTIMGGHQIYVSRFRSRRAGQTPQWLDHIDTIMLKVKLGLAFVGVSSVVLLQDCLSATAVPHELWIQHLVIHATFLGTTLVIALVWRLMHPKQ
ncbi:MAG: YqhA family protein [Candidatus Obscuribacterales bacterium]|nr:YqhA family protein [Candidatus Obscuribacterales bacterium]